MYPLAERGWKPAGSRSAGIRIVGIPRSRPIPASSPPAVRTATSGVPGARARRGSSTSSVFPEKELKTRILRPLRRGGSA